MASISLGLSCFAQYNVLQDHHVAANGRTLLFLRWGNFALCDLVTPLSLHLLLGMKLESQWNHGHSSIATAYEDSRLSSTKAPVSPGTNPGKDCSLHGSSW